PHLDLPRLLGREVRVPHVLGQERRLPAERAREPGAHGVERARGAPGPAVRGPELHGARRRGPEALLGDHPRDARLRIDLQPEVLPERARSVDARPGRHEDAVGPGDLSLAEEARADDPEAAPVHAPLGDRAERLLARAREARAVRVDLALLRGHALPA